MGVEAKNRKVLAMADSIIMERVADAAAECFYAELVKTEDLGVGLRGPGRRRHVKDRRGRLAPLHRAVRRGARRQHDQGLERARARRSHAGHAGERDRVRPDRLPRRVRAQVGPRGRAAGHTAARQGLARAVANRTLPSCRTRGLLEHARPFGVAALCVFAKMDCCCIWLT